MDTTTGNNGNVNALPYKNTFKITYVNCKGPTLFCFVIFVIGLVIALVIVKLIVFNDYYNRRRVCDPIYFFLGNKTSCKKSIKKTVKKAIKQNSNYQKPLTNKQIINSILEKDTFQNLNSSDDSNIKIPNPWDLFSSDYNNFTETLNNNYLAMVKLMNSLVELFWRVVFKEIRNIT
jgi:hypothetical protein